MFRRFDYHRAASLSEAVELLAIHPDAEVLAGGTDLLLRLREQSGPEKLLVDIKACGELRGIEERDAFLSIGALTTIQELAESSLLRERYRALSEAARVFGCYEIRNRATIGGNVVHASPGAESGTPLFAFDALVELIGPNGVRRLPIAEFWSGAGRVELDRGELLATLLLPVAEDEVLSAYQRISRTKGMDLAALGVTVVVLHPTEPELREVRVALAAVEQTPYRSRAVEGVLSHCRLTRELLDRAKGLMAEEIHPRASSIRATPAYKRAMVGTLTERILEGLGLVGGA